MFYLELYDGTLPFYKGQRAKYLIMEEMDVGVVGRRKYVSISYT
jgi:hypothetical protein